LRVHKIVKNGPIDMKFFVRLLDSIIYDSGKFQNFRVTVTKVMVEKLGKIGISPGEFNIFDQNSTNT